MDHHTEPLSQQKLTVPSSKRVHFGVHSLSTEALTLCIAIAVIIGCLSCLVAVCCVQHFVDRPPRYGPIATMSPKSGASAYVEQQALHRKGSPSPSTSPLNATSSTTSISRDGVVAAVTAKAINSKIPKTTKSPKSSKSSTSSDHQYDALSVVEVDDGDGLQMVEIVTAEPARNGENEQSEPFEGGLPSSLPLPSSPCKVAVERTGTEMEMEMNREPISPPLGHWKPFKLCSFHQRIVSDSATTDDIDGDIDHDVDVDDVDVELLEYDDARSVRSGHSGYSGCSELDDHDEVEVASVLRFPSPKMRALYPHSLALRKSKSEFLRVIPDEDDDGHSDGGATPALGCSLSTDSGAIHHAKLYQNRWGSSIPLHEGAEELTAHRFFYETKGIGIRRRYRDRKSFRQRIKEDTEASKELEDAVILQMASESEMECSAAGMNGMDGIKDIQKRASREEVEVQPASRRESSLLTKTEDESGSDDEKENVDCL